MVRVKLYVEGGGDSNKLKTLCRKAFSTFLEKADLGGRMPRIIACGSRTAAYKDFKTALEQHQSEPKKHPIPLLLVDSEAPLGDIGIGNAWLHLKKRDNWIKPDHAKDDQVHLMVQMMEHWFLADKDSLKKFFGAGFNDKKLPKNEVIEAIPKNDVIEGLKKASLKSKKGEYHKGNHSFILLEGLDPERVMKHSGWASYFVKTLRLYVDENHE